MAKKYLFLLCLYIDFLKPGMRLGMGGGNSEEPIEIPSSSEEDEDEEGEEEEEGSENGDDSVIQVPIRGQSFETMLSVKWFRICRDPELILGLNLLF